MPVRRPEDLSMNASVSVPSLLNLRPEAEQAPTSGIVDVANYGRNRQGLIPLWVGEGHLPTPSFICEAATRSLAAGETFYTYQRGIPELRQAIARYLEQAITPNTRAVVVNSPANPTGWTAGQDDLRVVLDMARRHGLWIVADEIY